jgi:ribose transport system substrate-binding protein
MRGLVKRVVFLMVIFGLAFTTNTFAKDKAYKFGITVLDLANPFFVEMVNAEKAAIEKLGYTVTINDPQDDVPKQIEALENFIAAKYDAIIITAIDPKAVLPTIKKARAQGIVVIAHTDKLEEYDAWVAADEYEMGNTLGLEAGAWIRDKLGGNAEVAVLNFDLMPQVIRRKQGIIDGIKKLAPAAKVVADVQGGKPAKGMAAAENFLQAHPNIKVIVSINDGGALGALQAVKAAKKDTPDFFIGGIDATQEALSKIAGGEVYRATVDQSPKVAGETCVTLALKALNKETFEKDYKQRLKLVTAANIKDYIK